MPQDRGLRDIALAIARQAARRLRLIDEAARAATEEAAHREAMEYRAGLAAQRSAIQLSSLPEDRRHDAIRLSKELLVRERQHEAAEKADRLRRRWQALGSIAADCDAANATVYLEDLRLGGAPPSAPPPIELSEPLPRPEDETSPRQERSRSLALLLPAGRGAGEGPADDAARMARLAALSEWAERERVRLESLTAWEIAQETDRENFLLKQLWRDREIEEIGRQVVDGDADAIATYVALTLERPLYPEGIGRRFEIAFEPASGLLVVDMELPGIDAVPQETDFQYVQSIDRIEAIAARPIERRFFYQDLIGAIALRTLKEITGALNGLPVVSIGLNGLVPASTSADDAEPICVISILAMPDAIASTPVGSDPRPALRALGALTARPTDETPSVAPLTARPQGGRALMPLPVSAEALGLLLGRLAVALGFKGVTAGPSETRPSLIAEDHHPLLGGRILLAGFAGGERIGEPQVEGFLSDCAAVGAVRGLLFATGDFDLAALELAEAKPVELIDGAGLKLLLRRTLTPA